MLLGFFGVWGLGFRVWGLGFGVLGFGVSGLGLGVYSLGKRRPCQGCRVEASGLGLVCEHLRAT